jgi:hypothetical protein
MRFGTTFMCSLLVAVVGLLASCAPEQEAYLKKGVRKATQDDIAKEFGPPHITKESLLDGETIWMYRYAMNESDLHPFSLSTMYQGAAEAGNAAASLIGKGGGPSTEKVVCVRYVLTFNKDKVLKNWKREGC